MTISSRSRRWTYALLSIFVFVALPITLKISSLRRESQTRMCEAHFNEVSHVIHSYNQKYGHLPPAIVYGDGVAMHSWRVLILEFWFPELFSQHRLSEPWNSPHNALLASQMPDQFRCSCAGSSGSEYQTTYVAVVGPDTVLRTSDHVPRRLEEVSKDAVMLIELTDKPRHWMAPTDTSLEELSSCFGETPSDWGQHGHYVAADGRVRPIREITPSVLLQRIATPAAN